MKIKDEILLFSSGIVILILTFLAFGKDGFAEWKGVQSEFLDIAEAKIGEKRAKEFQTGIQMIWVPEIKVVDRCKTCHMAIDIPGFESEKQPFSTHPNLEQWNETHPFKNYGCTTCHGGQGFAVTTKEAHGNVKHWERPLLSNDMAKEYGFNKASELMEVNCNSCHRRETDTPGMPNINMAKKLIQDKNCAQCHIMDGKNGGTLGPEITYVGSKHPETFGFDGVEGKRSVMNWHIQHFKLPAKVSKGSIMPPFGFSDEEIRALSILVMSWRKVKVPMEYVPYKRD
ncbi:MAG: c-type cytochrome [Spirochaetia bacterium]|nr:c-type cytochrome [Spirochaetia bacterium]